MHIEIAEVGEVPPRVLGRTHCDYARHFNLSRRSCGHVWQARYFSCPLDERHLWNTLAYVERNPVRAGMVALAEAFPWSSAAERLGVRDWAPGGDCSTRRARPVERPKLRKDDEQGDQLSIRLGIGI